MKKRILFLGAGFLQSYVIEKAREMGYYVLALDRNKNAEGFQLCDEFADIDIVDEENVVEYARSHNVDGVISVATDFAVLPMSRVAEELNLPGINYSSATVIKNKASVRKRLFDCHADDTGYSFTIQSISEIPKIAEIVSYPVMVKPIDGSGSRGTSRVDNKEDFKNACLLAMSYSITKCAVAEPFVVGREYGVESFVDNGVIHILAILAKEMTSPPFYAELGHSFPSNLSQDIESHIKACVSNAIKALNINYGSVNMDVLISEDNTVHIVDIGARMGGNLIGSHIVPLGTGIDYMGNIIKAAVRDETNWSPILSPIPIATKILALSPGTIASLPDFKQIESELNVKIEHHLKVGDIIREYHNNLDGCGYVVSSGINVEEATINAANARKRINESIQRR